MKDYKPRPAAKGRKPGRKSKKPRQSTRGEQTPKGFQPLSASVASRERTPPPSRAAWKFPRFRPWRLAFVTVFAWLMAGLVSGAVTLRNSPLEEVLLAGNSILPAQELLQAGGISGGMAMSEADPFELTRRIAAHPRVRSVDVRRLYPGRLLIRVRERYPSLRVQYAEGGMALVDPDDVVLSPLPVQSGPSAPTAQSGREGGLPTLSGMPGKPVPGETITHPALKRGREALAALAQSGFLQPGRMTVNASDPFFLSVLLPGGQRLWIPHGQVPAALKSYREIVLRSPRLFQGIAVVDFGAMNMEGGGRIILRRRDAP